MKVSEIRRAVKARPFRPLEFHLDNGEVIPISSPEIIVSDMLIMTISEEGEPVLIAPEAVSAIKRPKKQKKR